MDLDTAVFRSGPNITAGELRTIIIVSVWVWVCGCVSWKKRYQHGRRTEEDTWCLEFLLVR